MLTMGKENINIPLLAYMVLFGESQCANSKERQAWTIYGVADMKVGTTWSLKMQISFRIFFIR